MAGNTGAVVGAGGAVRNPRHWRFRQGFTLGLAAGEKRSPCAAEIVW
jgi:hypothetical protein